MKDAPKKEEAKEEPAEEGEDLDFGKKKKKTKKTKSTEPIEEPVQEPTEEESAPAPIGDGSNSWAGSDRDYTYEEISFLNTQI